MLSQPIQRLFDQSSTRFPIAIPFLAKEIDLCKCTIQQLIKCKDINIVCIPNCPRHHVILMHRAMMQTKFTREPSSSRANHVSPLAGLQRPSHKMKEGTQSSTGIPPSNRNLKKNNMLSSL